MPDARRAGLGLILVALLGMTVSLSSPSASDETIGGKSYAIALSGWSQLRLIELGADWPTRARAPQEKVLYCRHVIRLVGIELGTKCAVEATTIADAGS